MNSPQAPPTQLHGPWLTIARVTWFALVSVVQETMQPAFVSLWLKPTAGGQSQSGQRSD